jgi:HK97 family phage portal protein
LSYRDKLTSQITGLVTKAFYEAFPTKSSSEPLAAPLEQATFNQNNTDLPPAAKEYVSNSFSNQENLTAEQKALQVVNYPNHGMRGNAPWLVQLPNTNIDYARQVGDPLLNSALGAVINWVCRTFPEAPLQVYERDKYGTFLPSVDHELELLIETPNPFYGSIQLWMGTLVSFLLDGNAYWLKRRDTTGKLRELYYFPHTVLFPCSNISTSFITHYEYFSGVGKPQEISIDDIVHLRDGFDELDNKRGRPKLRSILREIFTDNEATAFSAALLNNMCVPGIIISPSNKDDEIKPAARENMKKDFKEKFTGDRRGEPMVMSLGVTIQPVALNPQEMNLELLHRIPEERIAAVFGVPAIVAGLGAGIATTANFKEAREHAYESNIIPLQAMFAQQIKGQLLWEFEKSLKGFKLGFNLSEVRILQDDQNKKFTAVNIAVLGGWMKVSEARAQAGLKPAEDGSDDIYIRVLDPNSVEALTNQKKFGIAPAPRVAGMTSTNKPKPPANIRVPHQEDPGAQSRRTDASSRQTTKPKELTSGIELKQATLINLLELNYTNLGYPVEEMPDYTAKSLELLPLFDGTRPETQPYTSSVLLKAFESAQLGEDFYLLESLEELLLLPPLIKSNIDFPLTPNPLTPE